MFVPSGFGASLACALASTICWGSWTNFLVLCGSMRFELFYIDYAVGLFVTASIGALTLGMVSSTGELGNHLFLDDFHDIEFRKYVYAIIAGVAFNMGNIGLCKGIAMLGLALAFPLCVGTSMVLGTTFTYVIEPSGQAQLLFGGVFLAFCAVCTAALMHWLKESQQGRCVPQESIADDTLITEASKTEPSMLRKLAVCIAGGICITCWNPLQTMAEKDGGLSPVGELWFCTIGVALSSVLIIPYITMFPLEGTDGDDVRTVLSEYLTVPKLQHLYGLLGGMTWTIGSMTNLMAGASGALNPAESLAIGQCCNMTAIFWGVVVFKEFNGTDYKVKSMMCLVIFLYIAAISLIAAASN